MRRSNRSKPSKVEPLFSKDEDDNEGEFVFPVEEVKTVRRGNTKAKSLPKLGKGNSHADTGQPVDKIIKQAQAFNKKQLKALQPDPEEIRKKEIAEQKAKAMQSTVREIVDKLMPSIVVEVSLKLGGAMHAQSNAIKNVVDKYLKENPVIEDRSTRIQSECVTVLHKELSKISKSMNDQIPKDVIETIEKETISRLKENMNKIEEHIDQVQAVTGDQNKISDHHKSDISKIKKCLDRLPSDIEISCKAAKGDAQEFAKMHIDERLQSINATLKDLTDQLDSLNETVKKHHIEFRNHSDNTTSIEKKRITELTSMKDDLKRIDGKCCQIL